MDDRRRRMAPSNRQSSPPESHVEKFQSPIASFASFELNQNRFRPFQVIQFAIAWWRPKRTEELEGLTQRGIRSFCRFTALPKLSEHGADSSYGPGSFLQ